MNNPLGDSPSKGSQRTTRSKKNLLTSVGIEPPTSGLDLPLLCRLSYEIGQRKPDDLGGESRRRESKGTYILLDVLLCSIAEYFYELCRILASP